jgi:hypothetical protein
MSDVVMKRGDTRPVLVRQLNQTINGEVSPINLSTASSVTFLMRGRPPLTTTLLGGACSIVSAANGTVSYTWTPADTATAGSYIGEFQITWTDGGVETVPSGIDPEGAGTEDFLTIEFVEDIDGTAPVLR